jgi:hypothetical protein
VASSLLALLVGIALTAIVSGLSTPRWRANLSWRACRRGRSNTRRWALGDSFHDVIVVLLVKALFVGAQNSTQAIERPRAWRVLPHNANAADHGEMLVVNSRKVGTLEKV